KALPKAISIRETAMKKLISPGRRMSAVGLAAAANIASRFNPKDRRRADKMAHRAGSKVAARKEKGRKANLPQLRLRANLTTIRLRTVPVIPGAVSFPLVATQLYPASVMPAGILDLGYKADPGS